MRAKILIVAAVVAAVVLSSVLRADANPTAPITPPAPPPLAPGQCYTYPIVPGYVISTICRAPAP